MGLSMVRYEEAVPQEWVTDIGTKETLYHYFGGRREDGLGPQGFLTTVTHRTIGAHCHAVDQFQILFGAPGARYQRHDIPPTMVHYADAYATYGPLRGEDPPLRFFTLRPREDRTMYHMPADRSDVPYLAHRQRHVDLDEASPAVAPASGVVERCQLFAAEEDGMEAFALVAGPGASLEVAPGPAMLGQYVYVAGGTVAYGDDSYGRLSLGWQGPDDPPSTLHAGPSGCRVVVVRFPSPPTERRPAAS